MYETRNGVAANLHHAFSELESTSLPNPHSTTTKKARLLHNEGIIVLRPLPLGQTFFTFTAQIDVGEVTKDAVIASTTEDENSSKGSAVKRLGAGT